MAIEAKTPVDIIEALLAMQNTRKEAAERFAAPQGNASPLFQHAKASAEKAIAQLMSELSQFGDAVKGAGVSDHEFFQLWNEAIAQFPSLSEEQKQHTFEQMERSLQQHYRKTLSEERELPSSLEEVLAAQAKELAVTTHQQ